jgi:DNA-binding PadR family transcriptional regulator
MRKWLVPLAVLGAGGVGAYFLSDKGRETLRRWMAAFEAAPEHWEQWNDAAQIELDRIQDALNQIAQSLEPHGEPGH